MTAVEKPWLELFILFLRCHCGDAREEGAALAKALREYIYIYISPGEVRLCFSLTLFIRQMPILIDYYPHVLRNLGSAIELH